MALNRHIGRTALVFLAVPVLLCFLCRCSRPSENISTVSSPESAQADAETTDPTSAPETDPPLSDGGGYAVFALAAERDGETVSGKLYLPEGEGPLAAVICCHGFGGRGDNLAVVAEAFAENGIASCVFDFVGGSVGPYGADMTEMSVLTEAADLFAVIDCLKEDPRLDPGRVFLLGYSQGGYVATYAAGERPEEIAGLFLLSPAYVIRDKCLALAPDPAHIPETMTLWGSRIGSVYVRDALSVDIAGSMRAYRGPVLLFHGTADGTVPISYSEEAARTFPNAELIVYEGEGHGLRQKTVKDVTARVLAAVLGGDE